MTNNLIKYLENKKINILGFGLEGNSSYAFIRKHLKTQIIYISDEKISEEEKQFITSKDPYVVFIDNDKFYEDLNTYDLILKSPGISFKDIDTSSFINNIKSQLELLLEFVDIKTIGISGTKGKSTTSSLIYQCLKDQNLDCVLLGNIGVPVFDYIDKLNQNVVMVLEMSSHQLQYMNKSPNISILLNIYEEHLDHYKSYDEYIESKLNIFKHQTEKDFFLYNYDNDTLKEFVNKYNINGTSYEVTFENKITNNSNKIYIKDNYIFINDKQIYNLDSDRKLIGSHNVNNIMFVLGVVDILNLDIEKAICSINNFDPLPHRMELVGTYNDVTYFNDSIATIPESTINSINGLSQKQEINTLIFGGLDRGINYSEFISFLNKGLIKNLICLPNTGHIIADKLTNTSINKYKVETLEEAVSIAKEVTKKKTICLLSPASASYGFFKNFKERGNQFKHFVQN